MKKVFLDAGHGGRDPGSSGNGLVEKNIALSVTLKVGAILKRHSVDVSYSRTTDTFVELHDRANMANRLGVDVFVSIHTNAFNNPNASGIETYNYPGSTNGNRLALDIHNRILIDKLYTNNRGVKSANFAVLRQTRMASALIELAFISNKEDANILKNKQNELAASIARGILMNLGISYKGDNKVVNKSNKVKIRKGDKIVEVEGYLKDNTNYVEARDLFEKLGYKVSWDNKNRIVVID